MQASTITLTMSRDEAEAVRYALGHYLRDTDPDGRPEGAVPVELVERRRPVFRTMNRLDAARRGEV